MQVTLTLFPETAHCLNRDCLQPWFCLSAPSQNMHNSAAQGPMGNEGAREGTRHGEELTYRKREHSLGVNKLTKSDRLKGL